MEKKQILGIISQDRLPQMAENFCKEKQDKAMAIFCSKVINRSYHPQKTIEEVAEKVFGPGMMKKITFEEKDMKDMEWQANILKAMPHRLILILCPPRCDGYDYLMAYADYLKKQTEKHVIALILDRNSLTDESLGSRKLYYIDPATETFLSWRERAVVWVADRPSGYGQTRQVYLSCLYAGVLDMLKTWSETGQEANIIRAKKDAIWLNEMYGNYVRSREDVPSILKYADFDERLINLETETEFGKVTSFKAENLEDVSGAERRIVGMPWRRLTKELKLSFRTGGDV